MKPGAFLPARDGLTSTFHSSGLTEEEIWLLGDAHIRAPRSVHGRGDIAVAGVTAAGLTMVADYEPARHVNISGWPQAVDDQLSLAQSLAADATLHLHPSQAL